MDRETLTPEQIAAQCWTDPETSHIAMDVALAHAFARRFADLRARLDAATTKECEICLGCDGVKGSTAVICGWHYQEAIKSEVEAQVEIERLRACLDAAEQEIARLRGDQVSRWARPITAEENAWLKEPKS